MSHVFRVAFIRLIYHHCILLCLLIPTVELLPGLVLKVSRDSNLVLLHYFQSIVFRFRLNAEIPNILAVAPAACSVPLWAKLFQQHLHTACTCGLY